MYRCPAGLAGDFCQGFIRQGGIVAELDKKAEKLTVWVVFLVQVLLCQGCNIFGFLANPGPYEQTVPIECELNKIAEQKLLVWVEALPGSGANSEIVKRLNQSILARLIKNAGVSEKYILAQDTLITSAYNPSQSPAQIGRQAGAGVILYVRLEEFEVINLHSDKIYSGQMKARAFLINSQNGDVLCPKAAEGIVADVATELETNGREDIINLLSDAAAHCIVRRFYSCSKYEYQVNEERSTLNEMIRQDVY
jgi:hypothetical protein